MELYEAVDDALGAAAGGGHMEVIRFLLDHGSLDKMELYEAVDDALGAAAGGGHMEVIRFLLDHGSLDKMERYGAVAHAVKAAAGGGHVAVIRLLLDHGYLGKRELYEAVDDALEAAAGGGHMAVIRFLLDHGYLGKKERYRAVAHAVKAAAGGGHVAVIRLLLDHFSIGKEELHVDVFKAVQVAAGRGHVAVIRLLLDHFSLEQRKFYDAVVVAAGHGDYQLLSILFYRNSIINRALDHIMNDKNQEEAVLEASAKGYLECIEYLLCSGPICQTTRDFAITQAQQSAQRAIEDMLRMAVVVDMPVSQSSHIDVPGMTVRLEAIKKKPDLFFKNLCSHTKFPDRFSLYPRSVLSNSDLGDLSKSVYQTLFTSLCGQNFFLLTKGGLPRVEDKQNLARFTQLGRFYAMLHERNQCRCDPFLTGWVFSSKFFNLLHYLACLPFDLSNFDVQKMSPESLTAILKCIPDEDPLRPCLEFLACHSETNKKAVENLMKPLSCDPQEQVEGCENEVEPTPQSLLAFAQHILYTYLSPALAVLESQIFQSLAAEYKPEDLCCQIQGMPLTRERVLNSLVIRRDENTLRFFDQQVSWIREKIADADTDVDWLERFVMCITGRSVLAPGTQIILQASSHNIFRFHSSYNSLGLPPTVIAKEEFLANLNVALESPVDDLVIQNVIVHRHLEYRTRIH